jgi:hypothetical protein
LQAAEVVDKITAAVPVQGVLEKLMFVLLQDLIQLVH